MGRHVNDGFVRGKSLNRKSSRLNKLTCGHRSKPQISLEAILGRLAAARSEGCRRKWLILQDQPETKRHP